MGERVTMTAAMLAIALGVAATIKASNPPATAAVAQSITASAGEVVTQKTETMAINPSPVVDHDAPMFVGTGDGSNGDWMKH
jgi:hypothetical protein